MRSIIVAPDTEGMILWLRHIYRTDPRLARKMFRAGWPTVSKTNRNAVLRGEKELGPVLNPPSILDKLRPGAVGKR